MALTQVLKTRGLAVEFGKNAEVRAIQVGARRWELPADGLTFRLWDEPARVEGAAVTGASLKGELRNSKGSARLSISAEEMLRIEIEPHAKPQPVPEAEATSATPHVEAKTLPAGPQVSVEIFLPEDAECHLPAALNTGWMYGSNMPIGQSARFSQPYQFVLARFGADVLRLFTRSLGKVPDEERLPSGGRYASPAVSVRRVAGGFRLEFSWAYGGPLYLERFGSLEEATADYARWLEKTFDIQPRGVAPHRPDWLWNTRLAFYVDLWRSHGVVQHTYQNVIDLMRDLRAAGAPRDTLLYLAGWNWRFDGHYPEYRPSPVLGGKAKFKELVDTARETGFRLMAHLCGPGYDPCLPSFRKMIPSAVKTTERNRIPRVWEPQGPERILTWLGGLITPLPYDSGQEILPHVWDGDERFIELATGSIPSRMEAYLSIGGFRGGGGPAAGGALPGGHAAGGSLGGALRVTINGRSQECDAPLASSPEGYSFPFPFYFHSGMNSIRVESLQSNVEDWSSFWFRIHDSMQMNEVWTYPIACMNITDPAWQRAFVEEIATLVESTGIDAVHIDTHHVGGSLWNWRPPLAALRSRLPKLVFGSEVQDEQGLQTFAITQSSSLWPYMRRPLSLDPEAASKMSWQKRSPVSRQVSDRYLRVYPHLTIPAHFVPTGTVVHHEPPRLPEGRQLPVLEELLAHADEMGIIPTLRVNYRDYGLDPATRNYVTSRGKT